MNGSNRFAELAQKALNAGKCPNESHFDAHSTCTGCEFFATDDGRPLSLFGDTAVTQAEGGFIFCAIRASLADLDTYDRFWTSMERYRDDLEARIEAENAPFGPELDEAM